jgi:acyl-CoA synthetase (AMP-forming)/AMP-acid ligase II
MTVENPATRVGFADLLRRRALEQPDATAFTFVGDDGESSLTCSQLDRRALSLAAAICAAGARGERVLILYPPGLDYVVALFACFHAGAVAVPAYPPDPSRLDRTLPHLLSIARDARPRLVLTVGSLRNLLDDALRRRREALGLRYLVADELAATIDGSAPAVSAAPEDLALIQYTSGSTAGPRGAMLSHANLLSNSAFIQRAFGTSPESRAVVWLPPYHDMGLVGGVLQPVFAGFPCVLLSPLTFLRRPLSWLRAVSDHRATASGAPNFAYDLCVRRVRPDDATKLDLSAWDVAFNGAELVRRATVEAFSERFAASGFRRESFYPCYGLAESTLMVTGGTRQRAPRFRDRGEPGRPVASVAGCGRPDGGHVVLIVDPASRTPLPDGRVGEIWTAGPSVARGYWNRPVESRETFAATLAGSGRGPFLRTGDLGFLLDGELFVTGRIKELLVLGGRNYYPTDIEQACEAAAPALRRGCGAAFAVEREDRERLAVVYEVSGEPDVDYDAVMAAIRRGVARAIGAQVDFVVLIEPRTIPKTSSGKVQRRRCRALFLAGRLDIVAERPLRGEDA